MERRRNKLQSGKRGTLKIKLAIAFLSASPPPPPTFCTAQMHNMYRSSYFEHLAIVGEECFVCWLVLLSRERNNVIQLSKNISLYCTVFKDFQLYSFHNFSLRFILKIFLKFRKFQPRCSFKIYSYKKERVYITRSYKL